MATSVGDPWDRVQAEIHFEYMTLCGDPTLFKERLWTASLPKSEWCAMGI